VKKNSVVQLNSTHPPFCMRQPVSECRDCSLALHLKCRFSPRDLYQFVGLFFLFAIPSFLGMIRAGYSLYTLGWIGFWIFFFEVWEIRILCSHCPYYAETSRVLHCIANYGSLKLWRYHPEPITRLEKIQLIIGFLILGGYPFPFLILGKQLIFGVIALCAVIVFFWILQKCTCSRCVNFSCILNTVPEEILTAYLRRNPAMKRAWEEQGWSVDECNSA
jgi:hypothetical protein